MFCNHLYEEKRAARVSLILLDVLFLYCSVSLPHGAVSWFAVCDYGIS